jgi:hypothetical protein
MKRCERRTSYWTDEQGASALTRIGNSRIVNFSFFRVLLGAWELKWLAVLIIQLAGKTNHIEL